MGLDEVYGDQLDAVLDEWKKLRWRELLRREVVPDEFLGTGRQPQLAQDTPRGA